MRKPVGPGKVGGFGKVVAPVGALRPGKDGYLMEKVAEHSSKFGAKDNWRPAHVVAWERANGRPVPDGHIVMMADGDRRNLDPGNLVAVPRRLIAVLNGGPKWSDRETLESAVAVARLKCGIADASSREAVCGVCGKAFLPDIRQAGFVQKTCRECLDKGLRSPKDYGWSDCPSCGQMFKKRSAPHEYCSAKCRERERRARKREKG